MEAIHFFIEHLVQIIFHWGYLGVGVLMAMESTVVPVPSELVLIPAGYLAQQGKMNLFLIILVSTLGSWVGASFNYFVSRYAGKPILEKYGKYFFVQPKSLHQAEAFFLRYGAISTFIGRLLPVIRHFISIPAGIAGMNYWIFSFYTLLGAAVWSTILVFLGYFIGDNKELIAQHLFTITISIIGVSVLVILFFLWKKKQK